MLWECESIDECFHSFFKFSQTVTRVNSIGTQRTCFLFLLQNTVTKKQNKTKQLLNFQNVKYLCSCHHYVNQQLELVLYFYQVIET